MRQVQYGFTLIELMVTVTIVGLLVAVSLPAYQDYVTRTKWAVNLEGLEGLKSAIRNCMSDLASDGSKCATQAYWKTYGWPGLSSPQPTYSDTSIPFTTAGWSDDGTGLVGRVEMKFTGSAETGGYVYSAVCKATADGTFKCTKYTGDTIPDKYLPADIR